jgi:hypothetical protein
MNIIDDHEIPRNIHGELLTYEYTIRIYHGNWSIHWRNTMKYHENMMLQNRTWRLFIGTTCCKITTHSGFQSINLKWFRPPEAQGIMKSRLTCLPKEAFGSHELPTPTKTRNECPNQNQ